MTHRDEVGRMDGTTARIGARVRGGAACARPMSRAGFLRLASSLAVGAVLGLAGCGSGAGFDSGSSGGSGAKKKVAMFADGSINDGGWVMSCYNAMAGAAKKLGWDTAYTENLAQSEWVTTIQNYCDQGYDLIFAPGNEYQDSVRQVAGDYPDVKFVVLEGTVTDVDNIEGINPDPAQIGQLAGALAGLLTKTGTVGFIGGTELDSTKTKLQNYEKAARAAHPGTKVVSAYAGSFTDAAKGKEIAASMLRGGADVMYGDASVVDTGAREAVSAQAGACAIAQPSDLGGAGDKVIACSVVTDNQALLEQVMKGVESGDFGRRVIDGTLKNGGLKVGTFSDGLVTSDQQKAYRELVKKIEAGTLA